MWRLNNISSLVTLKGVHAKDGRGLQPDDLSVLHSASVIFDQLQVLWVGPSSGIPNEYSAAEMIDCSNMTITPEIVDSHTHLVFGGDRAIEYSMRLNGATYEQIAKIGGGIKFTSQMTKSMPSNELFELAKTRIEAIYQQGVGTIEIKSGYGLTFESEKKLTLIIDQLKKHFHPRVQIINTFMAAHAVPETHKDSSLYIDQIVIPLLKDLAPLNCVDFVDIFHEQNYFSSDDVEKLFKLAAHFGLSTRIHADEFNDNDGAKIAINFGCSSADHLLKISSKNIQLIANSKTVATLLPGTALFLGKELPPARALLDAKAKVAIASDFNPGSCHFPSLLAIAAQTAPTLKLNTAELWAAICYNSSQSLNLSQGAIVPGLKPRFSFFNCKRHEDIIYNWGKNLAITPQTILS